MAYQIPRNVKGEGRILFIFSTKALIYTSIGAGIGIGLSWILGTIGVTGILKYIFLILFALIGFGIGTLKVPDITTVEFKRKTGGENLDDVIKRWLKFKFRSNNKIYVYTEGNSNQYK